MLKLFVCDIDNTLFDQKSGIPQANLDALVRLHQSGCALALASGRSYNAMKSVLDELSQHQLLPYVIASNGAHVLDLKNQTLLYHQTHSVLEIKKIAQVALDLGIDFACEQEDVLYYTHDNESVAYERHLCQVKTLPLSHIDFIYQPVSKLMMQVNPLSQGLEIDRFVERFKHEVTCERFHKTYMDVLPKGHSKLSGLDVLLKTLKLARHEVAAMGDGENDRILLNHVGYSAAPSNAKEDIQAVVDCVVASAQDAGVAQFIKMILLRNASGC